MSEVQLRPNWRSSVENRIVKLVELRARTLLWLTLIVLMWGSAFPLVKVALSEVPPVTLGFLRFLLATPILALYSCLKDGRGLRAVLLKNRTQLIFMGMTGIMGYQVFQNIGVKLTSASNSSIIISSDPIMIALLSGPLLRERMSRIRALGIAIGFSGVLAIIMSESQGLSAGASSLLGDIFSLGAAASWAIYSILGRRLATHHSPIGLTAASMAFGTVFLLPPMYLLEAPRLPTTVQVWSVVAVLGLGSSCLAYALWNQVLSEEEASKAGVALFIIPVVAAGLSVVFLSEPFTPPLLAGMVLVFSGVLIAERNGINRKEQRPSPV
jgi:drug/metabolite transporter (DMT)-like permease